MKKTILIGLMVVLFATPCMAETEIEQIEPEGLFSLNDSLWSISGSTKYYLGFLRGTVYLCQIATNTCVSVPNSVFLEFLLISFFQSGVSGVTINGFAIPLLGIGSVRMCAGYDYCADASIFKIQDPWIP